MVDLDRSTVVMYSENHGNMMLTHLRALWEEGSYCDVVLKVGDKLINAHRVVLCAGSRYFQTMLGSGLRESSQEDPIEILTVDAKATELLLSYIYTGEILLDHQVVEPVLYAADLFDIPEAVTLCCKFLLRSLTPYNALYTLRLGDMHNNQDLYEAALQIVSSQFTEVVKIVDFLSSPPNQAKDLLKSDALNVQTEIPVVQGAFAWLDHNRLLRDHKQVPIDPEVSSPDKVDPPGEEEEEGVTTTEETELTEAEIRIRADLLSTIRFRLLPLTYLEGLEGDIVARVCAEEVVDAIKQRKCLAELRKPVSLRAGMHADKIYIAGGAGTSLAELSHPRLKMEVYDPSHDEWTKQPEPCFMETQPHVGALAALEGYLYVVGGTDSSGKPGKLVHRLHIESGKWEDVSMLATATTKPGVCVLNNTIYVGGGWDGNSLLSTFERYDTVTGVWKRVRSMNRSRMEFPMVACAGRLYSICGNTSDYSNVAQSLEVYDPEENGWTELQPTIRPRWCPGAAVMKDFIFVCGLPGKDRAGLREADKNYTVERFNPGTGQWSLMPALGNPVGGACLVNVKDTLYVLGGSDGTAPLASCSTAHKYHVQERKWTSIPNMYLARVAASVAVT